MVSVVLGLSDDVIQKSKVRAVRCMSDTSGCKQTQFSVWLEWIEPYALMLKLRVVSKRPNLAVIFAIGDQNINLYIKVLEISFVSVERLLKVL